MPRTSSSPSDRPKWLRFESGNEESERLFEHGADWRKREQYPEIKPVVDYTRDDYLRLAWELLRRMPRYRHQFHRLQKFGIMSPSFFRTSRHHFYSSENRAAFPGWRNYPLLGHFCDPPIQDGETFGSYVARLGWSDVNQEEEGQPWFVMNRYKWVMDFWGMEYLPDPQAEYDALRGKRVFASPATLITHVSADSPADRPQALNTYLRSNEVLSRLRLDVSFDLQVQALQKEFAQAQRVAVERKERAFDPLPRPGRRKPGKAVVVGDDDDFHIQSRDVAKAGRVVINHIELHPFWLRTWDAVAQARIQQGTINPRLDRSEISGLFASEYNKYGIKQPSRPNAALNLRRQNTDLDKMIIEATKNSAMVPNWRARSEKYIEESDDAFRQIVAMAFAMKAD